MKPIRPQRLTLKHAFVLLCLAVFTLGCPETTPTPGVDKTEVVFFRTAEGGSSGPTVPTTFTITEEWELAALVTYHWNPGAWFSQRQGSSEPAGTIGLKATDGTLYGPWPAFLTLEPDKFYEYHHVFWGAYPTVTLAPGTYTVMDSDPGSWMQNRETGGAGMFWSKGLHRTILGMWNPSLDLIAAAAGVLNGPTRPTIFETSESWQVTEIRTYHWNNGRGQTPGTIGLKAADGTLYGPWQAEGQIGTNGVANTYWRVKPGVVISPGTYTVVDSDPATWSQNTDTGGQGMVWCSGMRD